MTTQTSTMSLATAAPVKWAGTTLRVRNVETSATFYENNFQMKTIQSVNRADGSTSVYMLRPRDHLPPPLCNSPESIGAIWDIKENNFIELLHEKDMGESFEANNGNVQPHRGFGHIAFNVTDLEAYCDVLDKNGVAFHKQPHEGRMKNLAFALDPDGYWIEIIGRTEEANKKITESCNLSQTMIRVKDIEASLKFYGMLGMVAVRKMSMSDFSNHFIISPHIDVATPSDLSSAEAREFEKQLFFPVLELTHNYGTERETGQVYHNGNTNPKGFVGLTFLADDLQATVKALKDSGVAVTASCDDKWIGILDPDGYCLNLYQRNIDCSSVTFLSAAAAVCE